MIRVTASDTPCSVATSNTSSNAMTHAEMLNSISSLSPETLDKVMKFLNDSSNNNNNNNSNNNNNYKTTPTPPQPMVQLPPSPPPQHPPAQYIAPLHQKKKTLPAVTSPKVHHQFNQAKYSPVNTCYSVNSHTNARHQEPSPQPSPEQAPTQPIVFQAIELPNLCRVPDNAIWIVVGCAQLIWLKPGNVIHWTMTARRIGVPSIKQSPIRTLKFLASILGVQTGKYQQHPDQEVVTRLSLLCSPTCTKEFTTQVAEVTIHQVHPSPLTLEQRDGLVDALCDVFHRAKLYHIQANSEQHSQSPSVNPVTPPRRTEQPGKRRRLSSSNTPPSPIAPSQCINILPKYTVNHFPNPTPPPPPAPLPPPPQQSSNISTTCLRTFGVNNDMKDEILKTELEQLVLTLSDKTLGMVAQNKDITFDNLVQLTSQETNKYWGDNVNREATSTTLNIGEHVVNLCMHLDEPEIQVDEDDMDDEDDQEFSEHMMALYEQLEKDEELMKKVEGCGEEAGRLAKQLDCPDLPLLVKRQQLLLHSALTKEILVTAALLGAVSHITNLNIQDDVKEKVLTHSISTINKGDRSFLTGLISCLSVPQLMSISLPPSPATTSPSYNPLQFPRVLQMSEKISPQTSPSIFKFPDNPPPDTSAEALPRVTLGGSKLTDSPSSPAINHTKPVINLGPMAHLNNLESCKTEQTQEAVIPKETVRPIENIDLIVAETVHRMILGVCIELGERVR